MKIQFYQAASLVVEQPVLLFSGPAEAGPIRLNPTHNGESFRLRVTTKSSGNVTVGTETLVFTFPHSKTTLQLMTQIEEVTVSDDLDFLEIIAIDSVGRPISQVVPKAIKVQHDSIVRHATDGTSYIIPYFMTQDKTAVIGSKITFNGISYIVKAVEPFLWFTGDEVYRTLYC